MNTEANKVIALISNKPNKLSLLDIKYLLDHEDMVPISYRESLYKEITIRYELKRLDLYPEIPEASKQEIKSLNFDCYNTIELQKIVNDCINQYSSGNSLFTTTELNEVFNELAVINDMKQSRALQDLQSGNWFDLNLEMMI